MNENTPNDRSANSKAGNHSDQEGNFDVFWMEGSDSPRNDGWYWRDTSFGAERGPFRTSELAYENASGVAPQERRTRANSRFETYDMARRGAGDVGGS
jgi:hypothetical protein